MAEWGYSQLNGPHVWKEKFKIANGVRQSPIDFSDNCLCDDSLKPLFFSYGLNDATTLSNTGAGWKVDFKQNESVLRGGCLKEDVYRLEQFHCHWGDSKDCGSEHTVSGKSYPAEIHLVHWNTKYNSFGDAVDKDDGLAVLGVFFKIGEEHSELAKVIKLLCNIPHKEDSVAIEESINPASFIPETRSFWSYPGSLTTPPCLESVLWTVFKEPIEVSEEQIKAFRGLFNYSRNEDEPEDEFKGRVLKNYRPVLEQGERKVISID